MTEREIAARVDGWAREHRPELIEDLIRVVNEESVSRPGEGGFAMGCGCKRCADVFISMGERYGFETENDDYYCVSILHRGTSEHELGILGHMDVVPAGNGWHYEPYSAVERDGYVIGRGSSDNKGPTVMSLYVLRCIRDLNIPMRRTLRLIAGFNEESGMKDVEHYLQRHTTPDYTLICDGAWAMCIGEKGILTADLTLPICPVNLLELHGGVASNSVPDAASAKLRHVDADAMEALCAMPGVDVETAPDGVVIRTHGKAAHALAPEQGVNAIYRLLEILCSLRLETGETLHSLEALRSCFPDNFGTGLGISFEDDLSGKTTCVGGMIRYESGVLRQNINVRYAIRQDSDALLKALRVRCVSLGIGIENLTYSAPRYTPPDSPIPKLLMDTCHEFLKKTYEPYVMGGGTHARKFPNSLPFGPGVMDFKGKFGSPHGVDEAMFIDFLINAMKVYVIALMRLDRYFESELIAGTRPAENKKTEEI